MRLGQHHGFSLAALGLVKHAVQAYTNSCLLLGPIVEFRAKYVEPIQQGLWQDSTSYERRKGLKMLGVLKEDLAPKVHRADMSVLRNDLPPKKEFVITVPLTEIQRKAYSIYVRSMIAGSRYSRTKSGEVRQTTIWHW